MYVAVDRIVPAMPKPRPLTMRQMKRIIKKYLVLQSRVRRAVARVIAAHDAVVDAHRDLGLTYEPDVDVDGQIDADWGSYMDHRS